MYMYLAAFNPATYTCGRNGTVALTTGQSLVWLPAYSAFFTCLEFTVFSHFCFLIHIAMEYGRRGSTASRLIPLAVVRRIAVHRESIVFLSVSCSVAEVRKNPLRGQDALFSPKAGARSRGRRSCQKFWDVLWKARGNGTAGAMQFRVGKRGSVNYYEECKLLRMSHIGPVEVF